MEHPRYFTVEKAVGETPLVALERAREEHGISKDVPLAYAGRLDPMASGKLLILVGDECKVQEKYHALDKEYAVEVLFGIRSDTGDVLGLVESCRGGVVEETALRNTLRKLTGSVTLPYPHFSSKTVRGKPLHLWTLEGRLGEIEIPTKTSSIYKLSLRNIRMISKSELMKRVREKIEAVPPVTDPRKALGEDFRREVVRESWNTIEQSGHREYQIISLACTASSGTYMRSLAERIAGELGTCGLALSIHRTKIGTYVPVIGKYGFWSHSFR